jgi:copper chaperone NosL
MIRKYVGPAKYLFFAVACAGGQPEPIEFTLNEENCSFCRMAVSQREFAAQVVTVAGSFDTFDDIGCLREWIQENQPPESAGIFVVDSETGQWIDARSAFYVVSKKLPTPMSSGLAAYLDKRPAEIAASKLDGQILLWQEMLYEAKNE